MVCQNCQAKVDNDLIFCTNCGARLGASDDRAATVVMNESVATKLSEPIQTAKSNSNLKWLALIAAILAIPASLFIAYLLLNNANSQPVPDRSNSNSVPAVNRRVNNNSQIKTVNAANGNVGSANSNTNVSNGNVNANASNSNQNASVKSQTQIIDDRIEIAPGEHIAYPFKLDAEAKIIGEATVLQGESIEGYVYFQDMYDEHFPDAIYKVFDFEGKNPKTEQTLVKGDYVLVFINKGKSLVIIQAKFSTDKT